MIGRKIAIGVVGCGLGVWLQGIGNDNSSPGLIGLGGVILLLSLVFYVWTCWELLQRRRGSAPATQPPQRSQRMNDLGDLITGVVGCLGFALVGVFSTLSLWWRESPAWLEAVKVFGVSFLILGAHWYVLRLYWWGRSLPTAPPGPPVRMTGYQCLQALGVAVAGVGVGVWMGMPDPAWVAMIAVCAISGQFLKDLPFRERGPVSSNDWRSGCGWVLHGVALLLVLKLMEAWHPRPDSQPVSDPFRQPWNVSPESKPGIGFPRTP